MKNKLVILFLVILTIINVAALATIAYHRFHSKRHIPPIGSPDMHRNFIQQELDLSEKQMKEFEARFERFRMEMEPIHDSLEVKRAQLMDEISADEPSMDKLDELADEIGALQATMQRKLILHLLKEKSLLTPEQQKKFFTLFGERLDRTKGWRGRGRGMGRWSEHPDFEDGK